MKFKIVIGNHQLLFLMAFFGVLVALGLAGAYNPGGSGGNPTDMGHSADEIDWSQTVASLSADELCIGGDCRENWAGCEIIFSKNIQGVSNQVFSVDTPDYCMVDHSNPLRNGCRVIMLTGEDNDFVDLDDIHAIAVADYYQESVTSRWIVPMCTWDGSIKRGTNGGAGTDSVWFLVGYRLSGDGQYDTYVFDDTATGEQYGDQWTVEMRDSRVACRIITCPL